MHARGPAPSAALIVGGARKLDGCGVRKVNTQRLEGDRFGGLGADPQACRGRGAEGEDRGEVGYLADRGHQGRGLGWPPRYERSARPTSFTPFEARVRELLTGTPDMSATVLAERVGWTGSIRWFRDNVRRLRPEQQRIDPADRLVWAAGDAAQCDLWFPPCRIPLEDGSSRLLPVLVITAAHSRFMLARMIPTRKSEDLLLGSLELLQQLGRVPRRHRGSPVKSFSQGSSLPSSRRYSRFGQGRPRGSYRSCAPLGAHPAEPRLSSLRGSDRGRMRIPGWSGARFRLAGPCRLLPSMPGLRGALDAVDGVARIRTS